MRFACATSTKAFGKEFRKLVLQNQKKVKSHFAIETFGVHIFVLRWQNWMPLTSVFERSEKNGREVGVQRSSFFTQHKSLFPPDKPLEMFEVFEVSIYMYFLTCVWYGFEWVLFDCTNEIARNTRGGDCDTATMATNTCAAPRKLQRLACLNTNN